MALNYFEQIVLAVLFSSPLLALASSIDGAKVEVNEEIMSIFLIFKLLIFFFLNLAGIASVR